MQRYLSNLMILWSRGGKKWHVTVKVPGELVVLSLCVAGQGSELFIECDIQNLCCHWIREKVIYSKWSKGQLTQTVGQLTDLMAVNTNYMVCSW